MKLNFRQTSHFFTRALLLALLLFQVRCTWVREFFSDPLVSVNKHSLKIEDFSRKLTQKARQYDALTVKTPSTVKRLKEEVISQYIVDTLIADFCSTARISVSDSETEKEIESLRSKYPDDESLRRLLAQEGLSLKEWSKDFETTLLKKKLIAYLSAKLPPLDELEVKKYYESHKEHFSHDDRAHLRQIVLARESDAERIYEKLKSGQSFSKLASEYSIAPEKEQAGDLGWIEKGVLEVFDKTFSLKPGQYSEVLKSDFGFHIIELIEKESAKTLSFEQAKAKIREILHQKRESAAFSNWLDGELRKARILRNDQLIEAISIQTKSF